MVRGQVEFAHAAGNGGEVDLEVVERVQADPLFLKATTEPFSHDLAPNTVLDNAYISAGHFRAGLHQSTGSAVLLADVMTGHPPHLDPAPPSSLLPHISREGISPAHTAGRSAWPKMRQRRCASSCTQGTPAGLPCGMPGMGELMDGAVQQAPQPGRQDSVMAWARAPTSAAAA